MSKPKASGARVRPIASAAENGRARVARPVAAVEACRGVAQM